VPIFSPADDASVRSAAAVLLTLPGTPFLYYGEEIGLLNGTADPDEEKRTPMPWDGTAGGGFTTGKPWHRFAPGQDTTHVAAQTGDPASLLSHYRRWIRARHASPALARGSLRILQGEGPVLAFVRAQGSERVLVAHNLGPDPQEVSFTVEATRAEPLLATDGAAATRDGGTVRIALPPYSSGAFKL